MLALFCYFNIKKIKVTADNTLLLFFNVIMRGVKIIFILNIV